MRPDFTHIFQLSNYIIQESSTDDISELTSRMSNVQLDKVSVSPSTLKLPQLFSMTPSSGKAGNVQRRHGNASQTSQTENLSVSKSLDAPSNNEVASSEGALRFHNFCQNILLGIKYHPLVLYET